ncbi:dehydrogenase/reductase SDR family member 12 [Hyalella azteca]|uniref:Dehydrogenase/reductase SDR family member 12 n=1 Tax=Hyalella azteca TaxID=294128 RepID=A0A8B7PFT4_HYAAZ|nr:dehydrogenase/reductase SDR family member 12 [Hyalella azteca]
MTSSTWFRNTYFYTKGNREYTKNGFEAAKARFVPGDLDVDLTGRHIMITGANKGLGLCTAHELAKRGAVLHLVCRNMDDARQARTTVVSETGNDVSHLNHLTEDSRVVTVSSGGMLLVRLDPDDLSFEKLVPFNGRLAYSQTKRQQVVLTLNYAQMFDKVHFSSMHPGWVDTHAVRTSIPDFYEANKEKLRSVDQGADTIVWLAASKKASEHPSGLFFQDREPVPTHFPLAWTRSSLSDEKRFIEKLHEIATRLLQPRVPEAVTPPSDSQAEQKSDVESSSMLKADAEIQAVKASSSVPESGLQREPNSITDGVGLQHASDVQPPNPLTSQTESQNNVNVSKDEDAPYPLASNESVETDEKIDVALKSPAAEPAVASLTSSLESAKIQEQAKESTVSKE